MKLLIEFHEIVLGSLAKTQRTISKSLEHEVWQFFFF